MSSSSSSIISKILVVLIILCLGVSFKKTFELMGHHETHIAQEAIHHEAMGGQSISVDPLEHEIMYIDTIKDCIPGNGNDNNKKKKNKKDKCGTFIPNEESGIERVAFLAPPGKTTKMLLKFINIVLMKGMKEGKDGKNVSAKTVIEILSDTHMVSSLLFFPFSLLYNVQLLFIHTTKTHLITMQLTFLPGTVWIWQNARIYKNNKCCSSTFTYGSD